MKNPKRNPSDDSVVRAFLARKEGSSKQLTSTGAKLALHWPNATIAEWVDGQIKLGHPYGNVSQSYIKKVARLAPVYLLTKDSWWVLPAKTVKVLKSEGRGNPLVKNPKIKPALRSTGYSSAKYGPCEVCGKACSDVFVRRDSKGNVGFGHESCLKRKDWVALTNAGARGLHGKKNPRAYTAHFRDQKVTGWRGKLRAGETGTTQKQWQWGLFDSPATERQKRVGGKRKLKNPAPPGWTERTATRDGFRLYSRVAGNVEMKIDGFEAETCNKLGLPVIWNWSASVISGPYKEKSGTAPALKLAASAAEGAAKKLFTARSYRLPAKAKRNPKSFGEGDLVRQTAAFRRSIGSYSGGPVDGVVVGKAPGLGFPVVAWSNGSVSPVNPANLEHKKAPGWAGATREAGIASGKALWREKEAAAWVEEQDTWAKIGKPVPEHVLKHYRAVGVLTNPRRKA